MSTSTDATVRRRVFVIGGTGTIGRATVRALVMRGHDVVCFVRPPRQDGKGRAPADVASTLAGATIRFGDVANPASLARDGFGEERFDVLVSCLASRTGAPAEAWAIDHAAHVHALATARAAGVQHVVLLSAICVQKPRLAFQFAKLAFEKVLMESGVAYSIVRPTAYFKSLSGQVDRVRRGKPFLVFGNGQLTACKPISDDDLAEFLAECIDHPARRNRVLPIGGPGPAITPHDQGWRLAELLGRTPAFFHVPVRMLDLIIGVLSAIAKVIPAAANKAELAKIGRYYATESMLVWDPVAGRYDADATPSTGTETLFAYYEELVEAGAAPERGEHAVF